MTAPLIRKTRPTAVGSLLPLVLLGLGACSDSPGASMESPTALAATLDEQSAQCTAYKTLADRARFVDAGRTGKLLSRPDPWARQLSAFDRGARQRTLEPTTTQTLLAHLGAQGLDWTAPEKAYWQGIVERLSHAVAGLNVKMPQVHLAKSTGEDEFYAVYTRNRAIVVPQARVDISGDDRRDFFLLAHELFHILTLEDDAIRRELYGLLGFEHFRKFSHPSELEGRRLSNPTADIGYDYALTVQTPDGPRDVVPLIQSRAPLDEVIDLPMSGPPAIFRLLDIVLVPVDTDSGALIRGPAGELVRYSFEETDWVPQMLRNSSFIIGPNELLADNFASLMEWRSTGDPPDDNPSGFPTNDLGLLEDMEAVLTEGCG